MINLKRFKRSLAMLLAVLMVLSCSNIGVALQTYAASTSQGSSESITLGELLTKNLEELSDEEKAIISSGLLTADKTYSYDKPGEEEPGLIRVDESEHKVFASVYTVGDYTWVPVSFVLSDETGTLEDGLTFTLDNGEYVGVYTYAGNSFDVVVTYGLTLSLTAGDTVAAESLLDAPYAMYQDIEVLKHLDAVSVGKGMDASTKAQINALLAPVTIDSIYADDILDVMIFAMPQLDNQSAIELIYALSLSGLSLPVYSVDASGNLVVDTKTETMRTNEKEAALQLYNQRNGLDLSVVLDNLSGASYLEMLHAKGDDLKTALNNNYNQLSTVNGALKSFYDSIGLYINTSVPQMETAAYTLINQKLQAAGRSERVYDRTQLQTLIAALDAELSTAEGQLNTAKQEYANGLVTLNAQITAMNAELGDYALTGTVTKSEDIDGLIAQLDTHRTTLLTAANNAASPYYTIANETDVDSAIATLTASPMAGLPQVQSAIAQLNTLKDALAKIATAKTTLLSIQQQMVTAENLIAQAEAALPEGKAALAALKDADAKLGQLEDSVEQLEDVRTNLRILTVVIEAFLTTVNPVKNAFDNNTWKSPASVQAGLTREQYAMLTANGEKCDTPYTGAVPATLPLDETTVMYELHRHNVVVTYKAFEINPSLDNSLELIELPAYSSNTKLVMRDGTTKAEILAAVETAGFQDLALSSWIGEIDAEHFVVETSEIPDVLSDNISYTVTFTPKNYTVSYDESFGTAYTEELPYGYRLVLPSHADPAMEYVYRVNGERTVEQGSVQRVLGDTTLSRTEGAHSERDDLLDLILNSIDGLDENVQAVLRNGALHLIHPFQLRVPHNDLIGVEYQTYPDSSYATVITAPNYGSRVGSLEWVANKVILDGVEHAMSGGSYSAVSDYDFREAKVIYSLAVTADALGITTDALLDAMNVPYTLSSHYKSQQTRLNSLVACMEYIKKLNANEDVMNGNTIKDILDMVDSLGEEFGFAPETVVAAKNLETMIPENGDYIAMYYTIEAYATAAGYDAATGTYATPAGGMLDFYTREETYVNQIVALNNIMVTLVKDDAFLAQIPDAYKNTFNAMAAILSEAAKLETEGVDHNLIDVHDMLDLVTLLSALQTVSAENLATHYTSAPETFYMTTELTAAGIATSTMTMTVKLGSNTFTQVDTIATGETITAAQLLGWARSLASEVGMTGELETYYHEVQNFADTVVTSNTVFEMSWEPNVYDIVVDGQTLDTMSYVDTMITLPAHPQEGMRYDYYIGTTPLNNGVVQLTMDQFRALVAGTIEITRTEVDEIAEDLAKKEADLVKMVNNANGTLVLTKDANGKYALVLRINANDLRTDLVDFAVALVQANYGYSSLGGKTFYDGQKYHLQSIVDAFLNSGAGTHTLLDGILEDGTVVGLTLPGDVITNYTFDNLGLEVLKTSMELGADHSDTTELDFYVTMTGSPDRLTTLRDALEKADKFVKVSCADGSVNASVTLPDAAYGAAVAAMTLVGEADVHNFNAMNHEIALGYILELIDPVLNRNSADWSAVENTASMLGAASALAKAEELCDKLTVLGLSDEQAGLEYFYNAFTSRYDKSLVSYPAEGGASIAFNDVSIKELVEILQKMVDEKLDEIFADTAISLEIDLAQLIFEYEYGLDVALNAELTNIDKDYAAIFVDAKANGLTNKAGLATQETIAQRAATANAIVLLDDVTADLSFSGNAVLDLNGKTLTGNVSTTGRLFIVDNVYQEGEQGVVTGTVTDAIVIGGQYLSDVTACLKGGYIQDDDGVVKNKFFTFTNDGNNNLTLTLNATTEDIKEFANKQSLISIAAEAVMYLAMNHYNFASLHLDSNKVFNFQVEDLVGLYAQDGKLNNAIDTVLSWISTADINSIVNDLIDEFTDFAALAAALDSGSDGKIASYTLETAPWDVEIVKKDGAEGPYYTANVGASSNKDTYNLNVYVEGALRQELSDLFAGLADTTVVDADASMNEIVRNDKTFLVSGSVSSTVTVDLTHDPSYAILVSVIMANGSTGAMQQKLLDGIVNYYENADFSDLESAFDSFTVAQVVTALKKANTVENFEAMVNGLQLDAAVKSKILSNISNNMKGFAIALKGVSAVLSRLDITGTSNMLGSIKKTDSNGESYYGGTIDRTFVGDKNLVRGYVVDCELDVEEISLSVKIFSDTPITVTCNGVTTVYTSLDEALTHGGTHGTDCHVSVNVRSALKNDVTIDHNMSIVKAENIVDNGKKIVINDTVSLKVDAQLPDGLVTADDETKYVDFAENTYTVKYYNYKIGTKYAKTLSGAIATAVDGDTIVVLRPVTEEGSFATSKSLTIEGVGNITFQNATYTLNSNCTLTFKGVNAAPAGLTVSNTAENVEILSGVSGSDYAFAAVDHDMVVTKPNGDKVYHDDSLADVLAGNLVKGSVIRIYEAVTFDRNVELNLTGDTQNENDLTIIGVELVTGNGQIVANSATTAAWTVATKKSDDTPYDTNFGGDSDTYAGTSINGVISWDVYSIVITAGTETLRYSIQEVEEAIDKIGTLTGAVTVTLNEAVSLSKDIVLNNTQVTIVNPSNLTINGKKIQLNNAADTVTFAGGLPADIPTNPMQALAMLRNTVVVNVAHYQAAVAPAAGNYVLSAALAPHQMTHHPEEPATYTAPGTKEYWQCGLDGKKYWDANGTQEVANDDELIIPQLTAAVVVSDGTNTWYYGASEISDAIAKVNSLTGAVTVTLNENVSLTDNITLNGTQVTIVNTAKLTLNSKKIHLNNAADTVTFTGGLPADVPTNPMQALAMLRNAVVVNITHYQAEVAPVAGNYVLSATLAPHQMTHHPEEPATYTAPGTKEYWQCGLDGKKYWDANGTQKVANDDELIIPQLTAAVVVSDGTNTWYYGANEVSDAIAKVNSLTGAVTVTLNENVSLTDNITLNGTQVTIVNTAKLTLNSKKIHLNNAADTVTFTGGLPTEIMAAPMQAINLLKSAVVVNIAHYQAAAARVGLNYVLSAELAPHQMTHHPEEPATYTAPGTKEYWQCGLDGKKYWDANGTQEVANDDELIIPQLTAAVVVSDGTNTWYYGASEISDAIAKVNSLTGAVTVTLNENVSLTDNITLNSTQVTIVNTAKLTLNSKKIHLNNAADTVTFVGGLPADIPTNPVQALAMLRNAVVVNITHYQAAVAPVAGNYVLSATLAPHQMTHHPEEPATYTAPGTKEYWQCGLDGKKYWDANGTQEVANDDELIIPQLGSAIEITDGTNTWYYGANEISDAIAKVNSLTGAVTVTLKENVALTGNITLNGTQVTIINTAKMALNGKKIQLNNAADTVTFTGGLPADLPTNPNQALALLMNSVVVNVPNYQVNVAPVGTSYVLSLIPSSVTPYSIIVLDTTNNPVYAGDNINEAVLVLANGSRLVINGNVTLPNDIVISKSIIMMGTSKLNLGNKRIIINDKTVSVTVDGYIRSMATELDGYRVGLFGNVYKLDEVNAPVGRGNVAGAAQYADTNTRYLILDLPPTTGMTLNALKNNLVFSELAGMSVSITIQGNSGSGLVKTEDIAVVTAKDTAGNVLSKITYTVVVLGDTSCDGKVLSNDATIIMKIFYGSLFASKAITLAANSNTDGTFQNPVVGAADARRNMYKFFNWGANYTSTLI